jgi:putative heme utilization carrier protein HutX
MTERGSAMLTEKIRAAVAASPAKMTLQLARDLGVAEVEVIRAFPNHRAMELDASRWQEILTDMADVGQVHVIVSNGAATIEAVGEFGGFSTWGEFFNVQSGTLDMHIRYKQLGAIFAVEKPSHMDGVNTLSVQFFDEIGNAAFKVFLTFGGSEPDPKRQAQFDKLRERYCK